MRHLSLLISFLCLSTAFAQVFSSPPTNPSLSDQFKSSDTKANDLLKTSYQNSSRTERIDIKQTILQGSYLTDNLNRSGRVIFFGEAVDYLNEIKSTILSKYPVADNSIHVYITDDASLNAFATVDNSIYVNVGLLARVKTEDQLAFILCHEIMHIINHHIIGVSEEKKGEQSSTISKDEILQKTEIKELDRHLQSQVNEFEADLDGYGLFSQLDYHPSEALRTMELLETAEDPIMIAKAEAQTYFLDNFQFKELVRTFEGKNHTSSTEQFEGQTHPAVSDRWDILDLLIEEKTDDNPETPSAQFLKIKKESSERIHTIWLRI